MTALVVYRGPDNVAALYADGVLDRVGTHTEIANRAAEVAGITVHDSADFLRGTAGSVNVAPTLADIDAWCEAVATARARVAELRAAAAADLAEAARLEGIYK